MSDTNPEGEATESDGAASTGRPDDFATTRWSVVLRAGGDGDPDSAEALETLCQGYWFPLYAYVRRRGYRPQDAEDLTQAFFARFIEKQWVAAADQERGRFRSFLLVSLKHFLANEWDKAQAQKRGGHVQIIPLDTGAAESRLQGQPDDPSAPDRAFDRQWALALLEVVLARVETSYTDEGKARLFEHLKGTLTGERLEAPYAKLGEELQMSEGAVKVAVHRLRRRYRVVLQAEIAQTVASESDVECELQHLFAALSG